MDGTLRLWDKADPYNCKYDIDEVVEGVKEGYMLLIDYKSKKTLKLVYGGRVLFHQEVNESAWLIELKRANELYGPGFVTMHTLFVVEDSPLSKDIARLSGGCLSEDGLLHLKLVGGNYIADMVFDGEPTLERVAGFGG